MDDKKVQQPLELLVKTELYLQAKEELVWETL